MALTSMTGFADLAGEAGGLGWSWEARSVNARGLDLRLRLPEGFESLEPAVRAAVAAKATRGAVTVSLRMQRGEAAGAAPRLNAAALEAALVAAGEVQAAADRAGLALAPMDATGVLGLRGVLEFAEEPAAGRGEVVEALKAQVGPLAEALAEARRAEGRALEAFAVGQIDTIARLVAAARAAAETRAARTGALLRARVEALMAASGTMDEARLAQELALLAVKADVTEELDRLEAHVASARALVAAGGPVGRKLDFLTQEFNREANTLCAKAQSPELTAIGLEMKVIVDQLREQVQNVE